MTLSEIIEIRHDLHAHPQIRFEETYASGVIQRELSKLGIKFVAGLAKGTGVLGWLPATESPESATTIALRADIDALPISEETNKPYSSTIPGRMHACGHDGHTAILIGAAAELAAMPQRPNNVLLLFQPAEEGGGGGELMVQDGCLNGSVLGQPADFVFGLHGWTSVPIGNVATRVGPLMASTDEFFVEMIGQGGHAAMPQTTRDPIVAIASLITALQTIVSRTMDPFDCVVVTVGEVHGGTANNIIPMSATIHGTIRTMTDENRELARQRLNEISQGIAAAHGVEAKVTLNPGYPVVNNAPEAVERFLRVARAEIGPDRVCDDAVPTMGGEDFAYYGAVCPTCFYQLGLVPDGETWYPSVHTPIFDFNDDAIATGVRLMVALALSADTPA